MKSLKLGRSAGLLLAAGLYATSACSSGSNGDGDGDDPTTTETGDGDGDDPTTTETGDGDGDDTDGPGDGDGDDTDGPGDGDGDEPTGDGDGDGGAGGAPSGDGDGDGAHESDNDFTQKRAFLLDNAINPYGVLVASDDKIYVSGTTDLGGVGLGEVQENASLRLAVWRLDAEGKLDPSWGTSGKAVADAIVNPGTSYSIVELTDGSFVVQYSGAAGVSLVSLSAAGVFGSPSLLEFGWTADDRAELNDLCGEAADTAQDVADASAPDGICDVGGAAPDAVACAGLQTVATAAAAECTLVWPLATAPAFAERPGTESSWGVSLDTSGEQEMLVVTASGAPPRVESGVQRTDNDRYITRVTATDFTIDPAFNSGSVLSMDISNLNLSDGSRRAIVEADGSIVSSGYTNISSKFTGLGNHIALIRLLPDGTADPNFGYTSVPLPALPATTPDPTPNLGQTLHMPFHGTGAMAEAYGVTALSTGAYVTTGYGNSNFHTTSISVDLVATAYNPAKDQDGLDPAFGGNSSGVVGGFAVQSEVDPNAGISGTNPYMDRGRHVVALPDDRTVHGGVYDDTAAFYVITPEGALDTTVNGTGRIQYSGFPYGFFGLTVSTAGDRLVGSTQSKPRVLATTNNQNVVVPGKYAQSLIAIVDIATGE